MIDSLLNISQEYIRKNWLVYKENVINTPYYEIMWDLFEKEQKIKKDDIYLDILKKFITGTNIDEEQKEFNNNYNDICINKIDEETLMIENIDRYDRKELHILCDKIKVHHESENIDKCNCEGKCKCRSKCNCENKGKSKCKCKGTKRVLYIYKLDNWCWEFTKNPYIITHVVKTPKKSVKNKKQSEKQRYISEMEKTFCDRCNINGNNELLMFSMWSNEIICEKCMKIADEKGEEIGAYKVEYLKWSYNLSDDEE
jgi:hypothetical protein